MKRQEREVQEEFERARPMRMALRDRIAPPHPDHVAIAGAIGPAGEALTLWGPTTLNTQLHTRTGGKHEPIFPVSVTDTPWTANLVVTRTDGGVTVVDIEGLTITFPMLQPLPDGAFVIVGSRCQYTAEGPQHNAAVIGSDGSTLRTGVLGDGIETVRTTARGRIIVGYFDEGVLGNFGWGKPNGPEPIGAPRTRRIRRRPQAGLVLPDGGGTTADP